MKKTFIYRFLIITSRPVWLVVLVVIYFLFQYAFNGMFSISISHLKNISGGYSIPDMNFYYSAEQLHELFNHFGKVGLSEYLQLQWVDMFYPVSYSLLISSLLFIAFSSIKKLQWVIYLPFVAAIFDYLENFTLRYLAKLYPDFVNGMAHFAAFCTAWKWIFICLSIIFVIIGFFRWFIKKISKK